MMNPNEIRNAYQMGDSPADILRTLTSGGMEFPEAEWAVVKALRLDPEARAEMVANYDECI